jgi:2-(1,2-epoxy-1,2-dihydrophenyl)acetyl-CoA isomerase
MQNVLFEIKNNTACITLNRPEKLNSFNREMAFEMHRALDECRDSAVRCVYITGAGKAFSAGQDLAEVTDPGGPGMQRILSEHYNPIVSRIRDLAKPVVAGVNGIAAGAGANIALCCDVVVASKSAAFLQAFSKIGLIPDSGGTHTLPRLIGWQKASAFMMLGEKISADDAERAGMIYKVFADDSFAENAENIALYLSQMPTTGLAYTKQLLNISFVSTFEEQLLQEDKFQQLAAATSDFREGVAAFMEKRKPNFTGQ